MYLLHRKKNGIYAIISLFRSSPYPDQMVTAVTRIQTVSRSDGHCSHPIQSVSRSDCGSAPRDDLYSPERQWRPGHLDEPQWQILDSHRDMTTGTRWVLYTIWLCCCSWNKLLVCLARGELAPQLSLVSPKVFFSILSPMEFWFLAAVASGLLSWGHLISSDIVDLIAQILFKLNWAGRWHH